MAEVIKSCVMASLTVGSGWPFKLAIMPALAQLGNAMAAIARLQFSTFAGSATTHSRGAGAPSMAFFKFFYARPPLRSAIAMIGVAPAEWPSCWPYCRGISLIKMRP